LKLGKIGRTASRSQADSVKIKECRIVYKKAGCTAAEPEAGFADRASLNPEPYIDPNAEARLHVVAKPKPSEEPKEADTAKLAAKATEDGTKAAGLALSDEKKPEKATKADASSNEK